MAGKVVVQVSFFWGFFSGFWQALLFSAYMGWLSQRSPLTQEKHTELVWTCMAFGVDGYRCFIFYLLRCYFENKYSVQEDRAYCFGI